MIEFIRRRPLMSGFFALFLLMLVLSTFAIVPETKQAVIVRFGEPQRILNHYRPGETFGASGAGRRPPTGASTIFSFA